MSEPDAVVADLRSYYEREAALDLRRSHTGMRVEIWLGHMRLPFMPGSPGVDDPTMSVPASARPQDSPGQPDRVDA